MTTVEVSPTPGYAPETHATLSPFDALARMQSLPTGLQELDQDMYDHLAALTATYLETQTERVAGEYDRYNNTKFRKLELDEQGLHQHLEGKNILVTGGTGLIGSALLSQLSAYEPGRMVSFSRGETAHFTVVDGVEYTYGDIRDEARLLEVVRATKPDIIYHVAADKYNALAEVRAPHTLSTNIVGVQNVIAVAEATGVPQIVYASTGKASRPYSPDIYAASKKTGELLMANAAARGKILCSAARFTHVVDDSNLRRKVNESIRNGKPVMLQGSDTMMYVQSAYESAQLLLNAGLESQPGAFDIHAIQDLGEPFSLSDIGFGAIAKSGANTPVYFQGVMPGYEDKPWPFLFGMDAGDHSPLINSIETGETSGSSACERVEKLRLSIGEAGNLQQKLHEVIAATQNGVPNNVLRALNQELSWLMLEARIAGLPEGTLRSIGRRIEKSQSRMEFNEEHAQTNELFLQAYARLQHAALGTRALELL